MNILLFVGVFIVVCTTQNLLGIGCDESQALLDNDLKEIHDKEMQALLDHDSREIHDKEMQAYDKAEKMLLKQQEIEKESVLQIQSSIIASELESKKESVLQIQSLITASYEADSIVHEKMYRVVSAYRDHLCDNIERDGFSLTIEDRSLVFCQVHDMFMAVIGQVESKKEACEIVDALYNQKVLNNMDGIEEIIQRTRTH
jgi:hypothetical protein